MRSKVKENLYELLRVISFGAHFSIFSKRLEAKRFSGYNTIAPEKTRKYPATIYPNPVNGEVLSIKIKVLSIGSVSAVFTIRLATKSLIDYTVPSRQWIIYPNPVSK